MQELHVYLAKLIRAQLTQSEVEKKPDGISVDSIIEIAKKQHLLYLLLGALVRAENVTEEEKAKLRPLVMASVLKTGIQIQEAKKLEQCFEKESIINQPMKGAVLRFLYPSPEMREMSDLDILFAQADFVRASEILKENDYEMVASIKHHDIFKKPPYLVVEAHRAMYDKLVDKNQHDYFKDMSRTCMKEGCRYTRAFTNEDFYVYMMAHMAKHFYETGCGIRHLVDINIYLEHFSAELDREYLDNELEKCGILTFTRHMEKLADIWMNGKPSEELYDKLFAYMLDSGIYGKDENGIWNKFAEEQVKNVGNEQLRRWYFFPPLHYMAEYYHYLNDKPWLLPWAWFVRALGGIFGHKGTMKRKMIDGIEADKISDMQMIYQGMQLKFKS